jgi:thiamine pyrophosphokinase
VKVLVLGNGEPPSAALFRRLREEAPDRLLCADGGADTARRYGVQPDVVVGDLDSESDPDSGVQHVRIDADDTGTDLNKVLTWAVEQGAREAVLTGVTGGRTDHTLWNLSLLRTFADRLRLCIVDDHCRMWRLGAGQRARIEAPAGQRLSLSPLDGPARGVWTENLHWPLAGDDLVSGQRDGISNEVRASPGTVRLDGPGDLLLVLQSEGACGPFRVTIA